MTDFCYVYAIVRQDAHIPSRLLGLANAPLSLLARQALAAVVSPIASSTLAATPEPLLHHEAVVETLWQAGPTLPVRFGTILPDAASVAQALAGMYEVLHSDLASVGDKVELGLTILGETPAERGGTQSKERISDVTGTALSPASGAGTQYLEARRARYQGETARQCQGKAVIAQLESLLGPYLLGRRYRVLSSERLAVRAAYLVQPHHVEQIQYAVDKMRDIRADLRWLLSGPWPPYTFVTGAGKLL